MGRFIIAIPWYQSDALWQTQSEAAESRSEQFEGVCEQRRGKE